MEDQSHTQSQETVKISVPNFKELCNISLKVREEQNMKKSERIENAIKEAVQYITQDSATKMQEEALKGSEKADIYYFGWVEDPSETQDKDGNKTVFGENVRLLDMINKSYDTFIKELNSFFNSDDGNLFHCGIVTRINPTTNYKTWHVFVSWKPKDETRQTHSGGRGRGRGRGYEPGHGRGQGRGRGRSSDGYTKNNRTSSL